MNDFTTKTESTKGFFNRSLERALQIMCAFTSERTAYTLTQLTEVVGLPKATTIRLCSTLMKYGFMKFDDASKQYSLGIRLFQLGGVVYSSLSLRRSAYPFLQQLQIRTRKTAFLGMLENDELIYLDRSENPASPIRFTSQIGRTRPPYFGMLGQMLMASLHEDEVDRILEAKPLKAYTKRTTIDPHEFREKLARIRKQGYIVEEEEAVEGISGIAAPVYDSNGSAVAAVGIGFISSSADAKDRETLIADVLKTGDRISWEIGYTGIGHPYATPHEGWFPSPE
ncbi:MAG: IclR family transcriptional regulator [Syntrophorhabdaceae bacterium]|nr:IclR family transcriptional regulator [Syntrophorhabdaceae bacterium]